MIKLASLSLVAFLVVGATSALAGTQPGFPPSQALRAEVIAGGVSVSRVAEVPGAGRLRLSLTAMDSDGMRTRLPFSRALTDRQRLVYGDGSIAQDYAAGPDGVHLNLTWSVRSMLRGSAWVFDIDTDLEAIGGVGGVAFFGDGSPQYFVSIVSGSPAGSGSTITVDEDQLIVRFAPETFDEGRTNLSERSMQMLITTGSGGPTQSGGISTLPERLLDGSQIDAEFGTSVVTAGDVNGDGFSDMLVGAPGYDNGENREGRASVYLGSAEGLAIASSWSVEGNQALARLGSSVAPAGDINGDGYDDAIVGAPGFANGGRALLYLGSSSGLSSAASWSVDGSSLGGITFGRSVATAGDVNGDGFADVIVASNNSAFVFHGSATGLGTQPVSTLANQNQFLTDYSEVVVATAGDVDGDGFSDVLLGSPELNGALGETGGAFLYRGSASGIDPTLAWRSTSGQFGQRHGSSVSTAGDVNGDGFSDVLVGVPGPGGSEPTGGTGRVLIFLGSATGLDTVAATTLDGGVLGGQGQALGFSVATAGDINGDGLSDIVVGGEGFVTPGAGIITPGRAFAFVGSPDGIVPQPVWTVASDQDDAQRGIARFGISVGTAGDVNGDGFSDLVVGASRYDTIRPDSGRAFVYRGQGAYLSTTPSWTTNAGTLIPAGDVNADGFDDLLLSNFGSGTFLLGSETGPQPTTWNVAGRPVGSAGDVDGDGFVDVVVTNFGAASLYRGSATGLDPTASWSVSALDAAAAGDVDGDGFGDVIVSEQGTARVYLGSSTGLDTAPVWTVSGSGLGLSSTLFFGGAPGRPGAIHTAGDVNGDGFSDIVVGAPPTPELACCGQAFVFLGTPDGPTTEPVWRIEGDAVRTHLGWSASSVGDFNGDGFDDVIVGAPRFEGFQGSAQEVPEAVLLFLGSAAGLSLEPALSVSGIDGFAAGDVDGDGLGDLLAGSRLGGSALYAGSASGHADGIQWNVGDVARGVGDVNGDGFDDVGSLAELYYGNGIDGPARAPQQRQPDGVTPLAPLGRSDTTNAFNLVVNGRTPLGRGGVSLEWEIKPLGTLFDNVGRMRGDLVPTGVPDDVLGSRVQLLQSIDGLAAATPYHWRVRVRTDSPFFPASRWLSPVSGAPNATALVTAGARTALAFGPIGPAPNQLVFPDSSPPIYTWQTGTASQFRIEWSSNPSFVEPVVQSSDIDTTQSIGIDSLDPSLWLEVLDLATSLDFRPAPVFWRIVSTDGATMSDTRALRVSPPAGPIVESPVDGQQVPVDIPATLTWDANHNTEFEIRFSSTSHIGAPRVIQGEDFSISSSIWTVPGEVWSQVVDLSRVNPAGEVYWVVLARDALGRASFSRVNSFRVVEQSLPPEAVTYGGRHVRRRKHDSAR